LSKQPHNLPYEGEDEHRKPGPKWGSRKGEKTRRKTGEEKAFVTITYTERTRSRFGYHHVKKVRAWETSKGQWSTYILQRLSRRKEEADLKGNPIKGELAPAPSRQIASNERVEGSGDDEPLIQV